MEPLSMLLAGLASQALPDVYKWGKEKIFGPNIQPENPDVALQNQYRQQMGQPINMGMGNRQQQLINQYREQLIPGLQEQFSGAGGQRSSAFGQQLGSSLADLQTNLGALGEESDYRNQQLNQQRLGELRGYLGQQQGFGLQAQDMGQRFNLGQQGQNTNRMNAFANLLGGLGQQGLGDMFNTQQHGGQAAGIWNAINNAAKVAGTGVGAAMGTNQPFKFNQ